MGIIDVFFSNPLEMIGLVGLLVVLIIVCSYTDKNKDRFGGLFVKNILAGLDSSVYKVLNDVVLVVNGNSLKIDHIVVSKYGVFVIKTKYYKGYIIGNRDSIKWSIRQNIKKWYISNPIIENDKVVKSVCNVLSLDKDKVFNIVCVPDICRLEVRDAQELVKYGNLASKIKMYDKILIKDVDSVVAAIERGK